MIKIRFITDGRPHGWRYRLNEEVLLPDKVAQAAIDKEIAIRIDEKKSEKAVSREATAAIAQAKDRSLK